MERLRRPGSDSVGARIAATASAKHVAANRAAAQLVEAGEVVLREREVVRRRVALGQPRVVAADEVHPQLRGAVGAAARAADAEAGFGHFDRAIEHDLLREALHVRRQRRRRRRRDRPRLAEQAERRRRAESGGSAFASFGSTSESGDSGTPSSPTAVFSSKRPATFSSESSVAAVTLPVTLRDQIEADRRRVARRDRLDLAASARRRCVAPLMLRGYRFTLTKFAGDCDVLVTVTSSVYGSPALTTSGCVKVSVKVGIADQHRAGGAAADRHRARPAGRSACRSISISTTWLPSRRPSTRILGVAGLARAERRDVVAGAELAVGAGLHDELHARRLAARRLRHRAADRRPIRRPCRCRAAARSRPRRSRHDEVRAGRRDVADHQHHAEELVEEPDVARNDDDAGDRRHEEVLALRASGTFSVKPDDAQVRNLRLQLAACRE